MRFLVTAGNTRERIDQVRDWGNIFTGNTGYAIAQAMAAVGEVDLLTSNRQHIEELAKGRTTAYAIRPAGFTSHEELKALLAGCLGQQGYEAVFMTAAVADYRPAGVYAVVERRPGGEAGVEQWVVRNVQAGKVKSTHKAIAILGEPTEKLVDLFRTAWGYRGVLVKFKLEVGIAAEELLKIGEQSRKASGADYLVANTLEMVQGERPGAYVLSEAGAEWVSREALAGRLREIVIQSTKNPVDGKKG